MELQKIGGALGNSLAQIGNYTAKAAARANGVSFAAQSAQGTFNQNSANIANAISSSNLADQYAYNSAQAAEANNFTQQMWNQAAAYNTSMFERQMEFNEKQAAINREFQKIMDATKYQRAVRDMEKAGLNPILAVTGGGVSAGTAGGSTASISAPSMSGASGISASGGVLSGISASEGNFTGQMEYMSGILGLISAAIGGFSSAFSNLGSLGDLGEALGKGLVEAFGSNTKDKDYKTMNDYGKDLADKIRDSLGFNESRQDTIRRLNQEKWGYYNHAGSGHSR